MQYKNKTGFVGIGTLSPGAALHVQDDSGIKISSSDGLSNNFLDVDADGLAIKNGAGTVLMQYKNKTGFVGIGTLSPGAALHVQDDSGIKISSSDGLSNNFLDVDADGLAIKNGAGTVLMQFKNKTGNVRITGDLTTDGNIAAKYQDVAEWVLAPTALSPGTVVVIDSLENNRVLPASQAYDTRIAGVVSAQPGILLGEEGEDKIKVAHSGRVKVKADAQYGAIAVGDLLVSSTTSGYAMRSTPVDLSGISIHRPGTIVGKALEPLKEGTGEILVLLTLQ